MTEHKFGIGIFAPQKDGSVTGVGWVEVQQSLWKVVIPDDDFRKAFEEGRMDLMEMNFREDNIDCRVGYALVHVTDQPQTRVVIPGQKPACALLVSQLLR